MSSRATEKVALESLQLRFSMPNFYNNTYDLFNGLNRPGDTIPVLTLGSIGFLVYSIELLLLVVWFFVHQGDRLFFCYPNWHLKMRGKPVGRSMATTHLLMLTSIIGCAYKLGSSAIMVGEQATMRIGPEFICFIFIDLCWYDVSFGVLLLILLKVITIQWYYGREDTVKVKRATKITRIGIVVVAGLSMVNALFTTLALVLSPTSEILGPMLYAVTFPILGGIKVLFMVMAIVFGSILIWISKNSGGAEIQPAKEIELQDVKVNSAPSPRNLDTPNSDADLGKDEPRNQVKEKRRRWSETLKKNRALGIRVIVMILLVIMSHVGLIAMIPMAYFLGIIPLFSVYLLPGALLNLLLLILFAPEKAKWRTLALSCKIIKE